MVDKPTKPAAAPPKPVHIGGESIGDRILPHVKKIVVTIIVVAVALTGFFTYRWMRERKKIEATGKLVPALALANEPVIPADKVAKPDPKKPPADDSFPTQADKAKAILAEADKAGATIPSHAYKAGLLADAGQLPAAIAEYKLGTDDKTIEGVLCREGLGLALEAQAMAEKDPAAQEKGLQDALAAFVAMQPDEHGARHAYALYHQARIDVLLNKKDEAKALLEKAKTAVAAKPPTESAAVLGDDSEPPDPALAELIEKRLSALGAS
ncbi:MAG TPA: hypothetical protein VGM88_33555 [Kofleriaceae bacterium]|jgi:hypothetical protein